MTADNPNPITYRRTLITPALAAKMLSDRPDRQRLISENAVKLYVDDMLAERWHENGETIKQDKDGLLLDGQHRLTAVVRSGVSVWMTVAKGVPAETFSTIDIGRKRTAGDIVSIAGFQRGPVRAAVSRLLLAIEHAHETGVIVMGKHSAEELLAFIASHEAELDLAVGIYDGVRRLRPTSAIAAALTYLHRFNEKEARAFTAGIVDGVGLQPNTALLALRNRLLEHEAATNENYCRRIAEVTAMYGAHVRGIQTVRMIPLHMTEAGALLMPLVQADAKTAVDHRGRPMHRSSAAEIRREAIARRPNRKVRPGG